VTEFTLTINGEALKAEQTFSVINPATEELVAKCPDASLDDLDRAVQAAQTAFAAWSALPENERADCLKKASSIALDHKDELARLLTLEQGKPYEAACCEIDDMSNQLNLTSEQRLPVIVLSDDETTRIELHHKPLGVVAIIVPWNYPFEIAYSRMAAALMVGNTVVIKPSPHTPLTTLRYAELIRDVFPAGVMNIISGGDEVGAALTQHSLVRHINFTGSVATGKAIAKNASDDLKRVTLELGGNDAAIVLDDVNIKEVAEPIFWGAFENSGQACTAIKRLYVHEKVYEPLVAALQNIAENIKIGEGLEPQIQMGPLNNKQQLDIVKELVNDAKSHGATMLTGGKQLERSGYFYPPTLITNVKEGIRIVDEEQFGPVLPIMKFATVEEAVERANKTALGLGASVWSSDWQKASDIANQLESGIAWVNEANTLNPEIPFGGVKHSGIGRIHSHWGQEELTNMQTLSIKKKPS